MTRRTPQNIPDPESVSSTPDLRQRPSRAADYTAESSALVALAQAMAISPNEMLQELVRGMVLERNVPFVDEVAERARSLGGNALGTLTEFTKRARLKEQCGAYPDAKGMLAQLRADHEAVIRKLR